MLNRTNYQRILKALHIYEESRCADVLWKFLKEPRTIAQIHAHLKRSEKAWMKYIDDLVNANANANEKAQ
jgi:hypothetical protein